MMWRNTKNKEGRREGKQMGENFLRFSVPQGRPRITVNECEPSSNECGYFQLFIQWFCYSFIIGMKTNKCDNLVCWPEDLESITPPFTL